MECVLTDSFKNRNSVTDYSEIHIICAEIDIHGGLLL